MTTWMLYGANGYTGRLIIEAAQRRGWQPILAGRNRSEIEALASEHGLECRVFDLDEMASHLDGVSAVLLAAGPFMFTSELAIDACIARGIHYLDITGEIGVFEAAQKQDQRAKAAGSVILPGVGFDVVPSDCLAASLASAMPNAVSLELAFSGGKLSKGTTKTMLAHVGDGGAIRENGQIKNVPLAYDTKNIDFHDKTRFCMTIPWGDVSTAYHSTGIGTIRVYTKASKASARQMKLVKYLAPVLKAAMVQKQLGRLIEARVKGPDSAERAAMKTELWGQVRDEAGNTLVGTLTTPEGYALTAECAAVSAERIASVSPGFHTPSSAFGASFITEFTGCTLRVPAT